MNASIDGAPLSAPLALSDAHRAAGAAEDEEARIPFGPYAGARLGEVLAVDPEHLLILVREGLGPAELRAAAAQALARGHGRGSRRSDLLVRAGAEVPFVVGPASRRRESISPWIIGIGSGLLVLGLQALSPGSHRIPVVGVPTPVALAALAPEDQPVTPATSSREPEAATVREESLAARSATSTTGAGQAAVDPVAQDPGAPCGRRSAGAIPADQAAGHLDQFQAVEFPVLGSKDTGKVTFLNSHDPYQGHFYVAIFPNLYGRFPAPPAESLLGRCIVVQGKIEAYRDVPQILLRDADDLRDLGPVR